MLERKHRVSTKVKAMKSYRIGLLFTLKNGDFSAISGTKRSCAPPISKVESHISDRFRATLWCNCNPRGGGGVLDISPGGAVRRGPSNPDPV